MNPQLLEGLGLFQWLGFALLVGAWPIYEYVKLRRRTRLAEERAEQLSQAYQHRFEALDAVQRQALEKRLQHPQPLRTPPPGIGVMRLVVEIDSGSEGARQLAQRARNWRARWDQTAWPPTTHTIFLWITDKGFARLEAIWSAWTQHALLPAFFTTVETLSLGTGRL